MIGIVKWAIARTDRSWMSSDLIAQFCEFLRLATFSDRPIFFSAGSLDATTAIAGFLSEQAPRSVMHSAAYNSAYQESLTLMQILTQRARLLNANAFPMGQTADLLVGDSGGSTTAEGLLLSCKNLHAAAQPQVLQVASSADVDNIVNSAFGKLIMVSDEIILIDRFMGEPGGHNFVEFAGVMHSFAKQCSSAAIARGTHLTLRFVTSDSVKARNGRCPASPAQLFRYQGDLGQYAINNGSASGRLSSPSVDVFLERVNDSVLTPIHDRFLLAFPGQLALQIGRGFDWRLGTTVTISHQQFSRALVNFMTILRGQQPGLVSHIAI